MSVEIYYADRPLERGGLIEEAIYDDELKLMEFTIINNTDARLSLFEFSLGDTIPDYAYELVRKPAEILPGRSAVLAVRVRGVNLQDVPSEDIMAHITWQSERVLG